MIRLKIPFYSYRNDDLHCLQASLKMVLSVIDPTVRHSYESLEKITGFHVKCLTWDTKTMLWLAQNGFSVKKISSLDYHAFAKQGETYLKDFWRPDVYEAQNSMSNLEKEQQLVQRLLKTENVKLFAKRPTLSVLRQHLESGWMAILNIDISILDGTQNYGPHSTVVTGINSSSVFFHDPGIPPRKNRRVSRKKFAEIIKYGELMLIKARSSY